MSNDIPQVEFREAETLDDETALLNETGDLGNAETGDWTGADDETAEEG